ncbi:NTP transferase domain-containing protein [bacterium]|nr:NTP transferase domain-containing protein [bacterium]
MQAVILAAGASSRFWPLNKRHKSLIKIMGKPLIWYTIDGMRKAGVREIIIVQDKKKEIEKELSGYNFGKIKIKYIVQPEPKGMGDALYRARNLLGSKFFVLNAERIDVKDYIEQAKIRFRKDSLILFGVKTSTPHLFGILDVKGDKVLRIVEKPVCGSEPSNLRVLGIYALSREFFDYYQKVKGHMYDFEDALNLFIEDKGARVIRIKRETFSLKYPWHLFEIKKYLMDKYLRRKISKSATISKGVIIEGKVYIGRNTRIYEGAIIKGPCYIGEGCVIGNNALVRDYTDLEANCLIGGLAEVTRCIFQEGCHTHSGYFGDSMFGKSCRVGAGTVTANIRLDREEIKSVVKGKKVSTGLKKFGAVIGEDTKIGVNVSLMPGVLIGSNCNIGPHSIVLKNIKDNITFFSKFKNVKKSKSSST